MDLRDYERHKFAIADLLRSAARLADDQPVEWQDRLQDLAVRLAEDRFNLVVVGRFSRGKTTLMNAILGMDRLPIGVVPITSVITSVAYGSMEKVLVHYRDRRLDEEISLRELPHYITQQGNPSNSRGVKLVEVQLPAEILRRGFYLIDTPGLGSAIEENTRTTERFLPEGDAFLLVTSYDSPLSAEETACARAFIASRRPLFVALNKHDAASAGDRAQALAYVKTQLREVGGYAPRIFSVSARDGLAAKLAHDQALLDRSGIRDLEQELVCFLLAEKSNRFLTGLCDRLGDLLHASPKGQATVLLDQLYVLKRELAHADGAAPAEPLSPTVASTNLASCEVCRAISDALFDFLKHYQHDLCVSHDAQQWLAEMNGLCSFHTHQLAAISSQQGICEGYSPLLERWSAALREAAQDADPARMQNAIGALLPSREHCVICGVRTKAEADAIASLAASLSGEAPRALSDLSALCFSHFAMLAGALSEIEILGSLTLRQADIFERVAEDMHRYSLKRDARRSFSTSAEEDGAAVRGISLVAGLKQVGGFAG